MYVVRRAFRNYNEMQVPGSVVEPGTIKHFKSRLRERDIVEVSEQDFDKWNQYFLGKFGVPINVPEEPKPEEPKPEEPKPEEPKPEEPKPEEPKPVAVAKVVVPVK